MPYQAGCGQALRMKADFHAVRYRYALGHLGAKGVDLQIGNISLRAALDVADFLRDTRNIVLREGARVLIHMNTADGAMLTGEGQIGKTCAMRSMA